MTATTERQRTWTKIGADYNATDEQKAALSAIFDDLDWVTIPAENVPFCQGECIKACISELRLPKVSHAAWNGTLDFFDGSERCCFGVYGIRAHYKNGAAEIFVLDEGSRSVVLCSDLYPNEAANG